MPRRPKLVLLAACLLAHAAAGCVTDSTGTTEPPGFPWITKFEVPQSRGQLKNPSTLDLTYAQWQEQLGNLPEAREGYNRVLKTQPHSIDARLGLARLEQLAGHTDAAEQAYREIAKDAAGDAHALDALGQYYVAERRMPEAIAVLQDAVKVAPDDNICRYHLAVALAKSGDTAQALAEFGKSVGEAEAHYNVGYICFEEGRRDIAEREFLQAITLRPDLTSAQTMLDELRSGRNRPAQSLQAATATSQAASRAGMSAAPAAQRAVVSQTVAMLPPEIPHYVSPTSASLPESAPATASQSPQPESQPIWQMPTRREATGGFHR